MSICFAFITDGNSDNFLEQGIESVLKQSLPDCEIMVVGNTCLKHPKVTFIPFDESLRRSWITRKKNLVAEASQKEVLVIMHDYFALTEEWTHQKVQNLLDASWDVAVTSILNPDGSRYRDWLLWPFSHRFLRTPFVYTLGNLLPYRVNDLTDFMYINGSLMIVRRKYLLDNPLDESRGWGEGEDVEWSIRLRDRWNLKFFSSLAISCLKQKDTAFRKIDPISLLIIRLYAQVYRRISFGLKRRLRIPYR